MSKVAGVKLGQNQGGLVTFVGYPRGAVMGSTLLPDSSTAEPSFLLLLRCFPPYQKRVGNSSWAQRIMAGLCVPSI